MPRSRSVSHSSQGSEHAAEPDLDALARLEQLLEAQLAPTSDSFTTAPDPIGSPPKKRKRVNEPREQEASASEAGTGEQPGAEVAFRLFSTQKAPQRVVLRAESTPPPVVLDTRIRDVEDEDPDQVAERRQAIEAIAVDGKTVRKQAKTLPSPHPPSWRLTHRSLTPSAFRALKSRPPSLGPSTLLYLDACLPRPLFALSPFPVPAPEGTDPPKTPHEGLIVHGPFEEIYSRRKRLSGIVRPAEEAAATTATKKKAKKEKQAGETEKKEKLPRMPKRNRAFELGDGTGHGPLRFSVVYPDTSAASKVRRVAAPPGRPSKNHAKRPSKAQRTREKKRRGDVGTKNKKA